MTSNSSKAKSLILIDGANLIFRAFYALPILTNKRGEPTNAILGFSNMLLKLIRDEKPDYAAVIFDTPEPTFRDEIYESYKSNRKEPPDELKLQFPHFEPLVKAMGIPIFAQAGYEADDLIGTIANKFASSEMKVTIISGDKDLFQLVNENVSVLDTMRNKLYGLKEVEIKMGVSPNKIADLLAMAGDSSDNIPGIKGVGMKTAVDIINKYGSLDEALARSSEMRGALAVKLKNGIDSAKMSKRLTSIKVDIEMDISRSDLELKKTSDDSLIKMFKRFELKKLISKVSQGSLI